MPTQGTLIEHETRALSRPPEMMDLLQLAISKESAIDVIERLGAMQREQRDHNAMVEFNLAMHSCQEKMKPVIARTEGDKGKYANYHDIDQMMRPIYTNAGFSLSFSEADCPIPQYIRLICFVSHVAGHTRTYQKDWPIVTKGPKGNDVMTPTHAHGSADSYAKRYLLKDIFNVNVGKEDNDGGASISEEEQTSWIANIENAETKAELVKYSNAAYEEATKARDPDALRAFSECSRKRKAYLQEKGMWQ